MSVQKGYQQGITSAAHADFDQIDTFTVIENMLKSVECGKPLHNIKQTKVLTTKITKAM